MRGKVFQHAIINNSNVTKFASNVGNTSHVLVFAVGNNNFLMLPGALR